MLKDAGSSNSFSKNRRLLHPSRNGLLLEAVLDDLDTLTYNFLENSSPALKAATFEFSRRRFLFLVDRMRLRRLIVPILFPILFSCLALRMDSAEDPRLIEDLRKVESALQESRLGEALT